MSPEEASQRIADLETRLSRVNEQLSALTNPLREIFVAKDTSGTYQERCVEAGTLVDFTSGRTVTSVVQMTADDVVLIQTPDGDQMRYVQIAGNRKDLLFVVDLATDGGVAGDAATDCSLTYTATRDGVEVGTDLTPEAPTRFGHCQYTVAELGICYTDDDGDTHLLWAGERPVGDVVTVVTDYRVDGATQKLQKKTRSVLVLETAAESDWTDVHTGVPCP